MRAGEVPGRECWPSVEGSPLLSPIDVAVIGVAALLLFGPDQLPKVARKVGSVVRDLQNTSQTFIREMERAGEIDNPFAPSAWTGQDPPAPGSGHHDDAFREPVVHERVEPRSAPEPFVHVPAPHEAADEPATLLDVAEPFAREPAVKKPARRSAKSAAEKRSEKSIAGLPPAAGPVAGEPAASAPVMRKVAPPGSLFGDSPAQAPVDKKPVARKRTVKPPRGS